MNGGCELRKHGSGHEVWLPYQGAEVLPWSTTEFVDSAADFSALIEYRY
jgi:hypothetical protein